MKKILISGASVAGPALAFWLNRYGYEVKIVERAPGIRPGGYAIDFRGPAMEVLEKMDIVDAIKQYETRAGKITIVDKNSRKLASMPDGFTSGELVILAAIWLVYFMKRPGTLPSIFLMIVLPLCRKMPQA